MYAIQVVFTAMMMILSQLYISSFMTRWNL